MVLCNNDALYKGLAWERNGFALKVLVLNVLVERCLSFLKTILFLINM